MKTGLVVRAAHRGATTLVVGFDTAVIDARDATSIDAGLGGGGVVDDERLGRQIKRGIGLDIRSVP